MLANVKARKAEGGVATERESNQNEPKIEPQGSQDGTKRGSRGGPDCDWTRGGVRSPFLEPFCRPNGLLDRELYLQWDISLKKEIQQKTTHAHELEYVSNQDYISILS